MLLFFDSPKREGRKGRKRGSENVAGLDGLTKTKGKQFLFHVISGRGGK